MESLMLQEKEIKDADIAKILHNLQKETQEQTKYIKKQTTYAKISAVACVGVFAVAVAACVILIPQITTALSDLKIITAQLSQTDWKTMFENINTLISTSQNGMEETLQNIQKIDIDGLNQAIQDLQAVVAPLAKLFGR
ncbi:MAG: hypothetical protein PHG02_10300 [Oscillospiraceae bacterium]|nr:hypothetical protein [Oscillospiraceae bacterium]